MRIMPGHMPFGNLKCLAKPILCLNDSAFSVLLKFGFIKSLFSIIWAFAWREPLSVQKKNSFSKFTKFWSKYQASHVSMSISEFSSKKDKSNAWLFRSFDIILIDIATLLQPSHLLSRKCTTRKLFDGRQDDLNLWQKIISWLERAITENSENSENSINITKNKKIWGR
jgi:hypothetical protein